jgi:hypothetical protein
MRRIQIKRFARVGTLAVFVFMSEATELLSQTTRATLTGTVTDPNGAIVPGATVHATNIATNITSATKTNQEGIYTFSALPPGEYTVSVEVTGFKRNIQPVPSFGLRKPRGWTFRSKSAR